MKDRFLEIGKIVNTHGIQGEVKIQPWANSPEFLLDFDRFFIDGQPYIPKSSRVHKTSVLISFAGIDSFEDAIKLKNKVMCIDRDDARLDEGEYFIADLIGLAAFDAETGERLGVLDDVITLPSNNVYVIKGEREILVPAVPEFVRLVDLDSNLIKLKLVEGM